MKVAIFNADGSFYDTQELTLSLNSVSGKYESSNFEIETGDKSFFVFANNSSNGIALPTGGTKLEFMKQILNETSNPLNLGLTGNGSKFLLGTLWDEIKNVPAGGTKSAPKSLSLSIGRVVSKIVLQEVKYSDKASNLLGVFSDARFRLGTIAKKVNAVGYHIGNSLPNAATGILVESAVHNATPWTLGSNNDYFDFNLTDWDDTNAPAKGVGGFYYATENTSALDDTDQQYYGSVTFVQLQTKYTPGTDEIRDASNLSQTGIAEAGTGSFWKANLISDSSKSVLISDPTNITLDTDINRTTIVKYEGGINYHKFPVFDKSESSDICKNRVLRNHYYEFTVSKFNSLGDYTDFVNPDEPVVTTSTVNVEVTVLPWDKVSSSVEVGR